MNKVILIGNLTDDPKTSVTANGVTKCTFRLATQRKYTNPQTGQREADFHNIVVWRQLADLCAKYLAKGRKCSVEGAIQYRSYEKALCDRDCGRERGVSDQQAAECRTDRPTGRRVYRARRLCAC